MSGSMEDLLLKMMEKAESESKPQDIAEIENNLKTALESLNNKHSFNVGDLVQQKALLGRYKFPKNGIPAIVTKVLETPIIDGENDTSSSSFNNPLDMVIGVIRDDVLFEHHVDSRRFEPYVKKTEV